MTEAAYIGNQKEYTKIRKEFWENISHSKRSALWAGSGYHKRLESVYSFIIPHGCRILEIGCGEGDLLNALQPSYGLGIDLSETMIDKARIKHPLLHFEVMDAHSVGNLAEEFDYVVMSDLVNDLWDVQAVFLGIAKLSKPSTRLIMNAYSRLWSPILNIAEYFHLATPTLEQNWLTIPDLNNLLDLSGFELIKGWQEMIFPFSIPIISSLMNKYIGKFWPLNIFGIANMIVAKPILQKDQGRPSVSIVVPARNEEGNIPAIFERIPALGSSTEVIFVEGNSKDQTFSVIEHEITLHSGMDVHLIKQPGTGKGDAVRAGFDKAKGDILMILDADLTVHPEDLQKFYEALVNGKGEFINGVRLVYPMDKEAMRFFNFLGNKFFSMAFSWILGQMIKDTLCGTKVLWKRDYEKIKSQRAYFGDFDPFGDFDLLFGAAHLNLKITDMPIRYHERRYGQTNISRWSHGWVLLKMVAFAARKIKFF